MPLNASSTLRKGIQTTDLPTMPDKTRLPTFYASLDFLDFNSFKITAMARFVEQAPGFISTSNVNFLLK